MYRKLISKYPGKCAKCGNAINRGDEIYWEKGNRSVFHSLCFTSQSESEQDAKQEATAQASVTTETQPKTWDGTFDVAELKEAMVKGLKGENPLKLNAERGRAVFNPSHWHGYSKEQMQDWIRNGFKAEAFKDLHEMSPPMRKRRKMIYADEGELQLDLMYSGFDYPFMQWTKTERVPGLSIDIQMAFSAGTSESVIAQYEKWIARMLYTLETEGIDLDVNIIFATDHQISGAKGLVTTRVKVKKEGEATDFARWSVMFSPGGYRGMMFLAAYMNAEKHGRKADPGLGRCIHGTWEMKFEPTERKITITHPPTAHSFPEAEMSEKLRAIVQKFRS